MSFERSYSIESHERIKLILIFADKSLLLKWWVTYVSKSTSDKVTSKLHLSVKMADGGAAVEFSSSGYILLIINHIILDIHQQIFT